MSVLVAGAVNQDLVIRRANVRAQSGAGRAVGARAALPNAAEIAALGVEIRRVRDGGEPDRRPLADA